MGSFAVSNTSMNSSRFLPDEIDGDERGSVLIKQNPLTLKTIQEEDAFAVDQSMYIEDMDEMGFDDPTQIKRYSVLNNDPSFKQYTKNHEFYDLNPVAEIEKVKHSVLYVNLKDLEESKEILRRMKSQNEENLQREQYRVVKKDLLFVVTFSSISSSRYLGSKEAVSERTYRDFYKLGQALQKQFPGCFVPIIIKQQASIDLPQAIFDFRKTPMELSQVENFCRKLRSC